MESFLLFSLSLKNSGTKAAEKAPSAVILLKIFANLKAIIKTSATKLIPIILLKSISLISPNTRLNPVKKLTVNMDFIKRLL